MKNFTHSFRLLTLLAALFVMSASAMAQVASLPISFDGKASELPAGFTQSGLGSDYSSSPKLKFDTTNDYLLVQFNSAPKELKYSVKWNQSNPGYTSTFTVLESADGSTFTEITKYDAGNVLENGKVKPEIFALKNTTRYVKWVYTTKVNGNIALGAISIDPLVVTNDPTASIAGNSFFGNIEKGASASQTYVVKGAHLTGDLTVTVAGAGYRAVKTTLPKAEVESEAGCEVKVDLLASVLGNQEGTMTISGGGLAESKVMNMVATVFEVTKHNSIAELLANPKGETVYELASEATIVFINKANIYLHDATGTVLVYNKMTDGVSVIPDADIAVGHNLKGLKVTIGEFGGVKQLIPVAMGTIPSQGNVVPEAEVTTVEALVANPANFIHKLVVVHNVTMEAKAFTSDKASNNTMTGADGSTTMVCRDNFLVLGGFTPPATKLSVTGFFTTYTSNNTTTPQIFPRSTGDISTFVSNPSLDATNTKVYATAGRVIVETESAARVEIFNTVGQTVKVVTVDGTATINLNKGLYIVRVNGKAVKVLVR
ncbi:MAG: DUF6383 domain-containing protein [Bacteroidales bacterium]